MRFYVLVLILCCHFLINAQNNVCLSIEDNPNTSVSGLGLFTKYVNVLDCFSVYAESSISDEKVLHAAAVAAELFAAHEKILINSLKYY